MPPTEPTEPPSSSPRSTDPESAIIREILAVTAVARRYLAAITAKNEAEAAKYTCDKKHPGMTWISSVGRPITLEAVIGIILESTAGSFARVKILVDGKPTPPLLLDHRDGEWCVRL